TFSWFPQETPVVWLTAEDFCHSALIVNRLRDEPWRAAARRQSEALLGGFYRILVSADDAVYPWRDYGRVCNLPRRVIPAMQEAYRRRGDRAEDFWFSTTPIMAARWLALERYEDGAWRRCA